MKESKSYSEAEVLYKKLFPSERLSQKEKLSIYRKYLNLIRKSAYSGSPDGQYVLGQEYENMNFLGINNPNFNPKKRFYWYKKAAEQNHPAACNNLAFLYETGDGCKKDLKKALELYKKSAELGDSQGKKNYKIMLKQMNKH